MSSIARRTFLVVVLATIVGLQPLVVYAITAPDSISILNIRAYEGVIEPGDLLIVTKYRLEYSIVPTELISDTYLGRFMEGATELNSVQPFAFNDNGFGDGAFSFYHSAADVIAQTIDISGGGLSVILQGNPTVFVTPPSVESGTITIRDATQIEKELTDDILEMARQLENNADWRASDQDLVEDTAIGQVLTVSGEQYFSNVIINLRIMAPDLFGSASLTPEVIERTFDATYKESLKAFWVGTPIDDGFIVLADTLFLPKIMVSTLFLLAIIVAVAYFVSRATRANEFGVLSVAITLPVGALIGLTSIVFAATGAMFAVLAIGFIFFYKQTS